MSMGKAMGYGLIGAVSVIAALGASAGTASADPDYGGHGNNNYGHQHDRGGRGNGNWNQNWAPPGSIGIIPLVNPWEYCGGIGPGWIPDPSLTFCFFVPPPPPGPWVY